MAVVVLIGFSCSGKSTFKRKLKKWMKVNSVNKQLECIDTDDLVSGSEDSIYRIFISRVKKDGDRSLALNCIQNREEEFLKWICQSNCVIRFIGHS